MILIHISEQVERYLHLQGVHSWVTCGYSANFCTGRYHASAVLPSYNILSWVLHLRLFESRMLYLQGHQNCHQPEEQHSSWWKVACLPETSEGQCRLWRDHKVAGRSWGVCDRLSDAWFVGAVRGDSHMSEKNGFQILPSSLWYLPSSLLVFWLFPLRRCQKQNIFCVWLLLGCVLMSLGAWLSHVLERTYAQFSRCQACLCQVQTMLLCGFRLQARQHGIVFANRLIEMC